MQYWSEMDTKWGFSEGDAVPGGIEHFRKAYLIAMNKLLELYSSDIRVIAFDRGGCHNWCLFLRISKDTYAKMFSKNPDSIYDDGNLSTGMDCVTNEPKPDEAYLRALKHARELEVDEYVFIECSLDRGGLEKALSQVKRKKG